MDEKNLKTNYQIQEIIVALNELKKEQTNLSQNLQKKYEVIMQKLTKLQEFNKISDMTNQVFEMRMANIEDLILKIGSIKT